MPAREPRPGPQGLLAPCPASPPGPWLWPQLAAKVAPAPRGLSLLLSSPCLLFIFLVFGAGEGLPVQALAGGVVPQSCPGLYGHPAQLWDSRTRWTDTATPQVARMCPRGSLHLVLDTSACPSVGAAPCALNISWLSRGIPVQCLEGLSHPHPPSHLFVRLCPPVRWELEEFRPASSSSLLCLKQWPWPAGP